MIGLSVTAVVVAVISLVVAFSANKTAREANRLSAAANTLSGEANTISSESKEAAVKSATEASKAAEEARKTRLEESAPSILISENFAQHTRWNVDSRHDGENFAHPFPILPGAVFHLPADATRRIYVGTILTLVNEDSKTAEVQFGADRLDDITTDDMNAAVLTPNEPSNVLSQANTVHWDGRMSIGPGETRQVVVRCGPTLEEWTVGGESPVWSNVVPITARTSVDGAYQQWELHFSASILTTNPQYLGQITLLPGALSYANVVQLPHGYPDLPQTSSP
jgi:hypothetical protein